MLEREEEVLEEQEQEVVEVVEVVEPVEVVAAEEVRSDCACWQCPDSQPRDCS